jgi:hypothetical protein
MSAMEIMWLREYVREKDSSDESNSKDSASKRKLESTIEQLSASAHMKESEENFQNSR